MSTGAHAAGTVRPVLLTGVPLATAAAVLTLSHIRDGVVSRYAGLDLLPVYDAGRAVGVGTSAYANDLFVYPPLAAVLAVPFSFPPWPIVLTAMACLQVAAVVAVMAAASRWALGRWSLVAVAGLSVVALESDLAVITLRLDNVSVLIAVAALAAVLLFALGRWTAGCLVLALALAVKPLLLPLLLVPVLAGRWRPVLAGSAAVGALSLAVLPLAGSWGDLVHVARRLSHGSVLVGHASVNNLSIKGLTDLHDLAAVGIVGRIVVVLVVGLSVVAWQVASGPDPTPDDVVTVSAMLLLTLFLAGPLNECHYLWSVVPAALAAVRGRFRTVPGAVVVAGLTVLLWFGNAWDGPVREATQWQLVAGQVVVLAGLCGLLLRSARGVGGIAR